MSAPAWSVIADAIVTSSPQPSLSSTWQAVICAPGARRLMMPAMNVPCPASSSSTPSPRSSRRAPRRRRRPGSTQRVEPRVAAGRVTGVEHGDADAPCRHRRTARSELGARRRDRARPALVARLAGRARGSARTGRPPCAAARPASARRRARRSGRRRASRPSRFVDDRAVQHPLREVVAPLSTMISPGLYRKTSSPFVPNLDPLADLPIAELPMSYLPDLTRRNVGTGHVVTADVSRRRRRRSS